MGSPITQGAYQKNRKLLADEADGLWNITISLFPRGLLDPGEYVLCGLNINRYRILEKNKRIEEPLPADVQVKHFWGHWDKWKDSLPKIYTLTRNMTSD